MNADERGPVLHVSAGVLERCRAEADQIADALTCGRTEMAVLGGKLAEAIVSLERVSASIAQGALLDRLDGVARGLHRELCVLCPALAARADLVAQARVDTGDCGTREALLVASAWQIHAAAVLAHLGGPEASGAQRLGWLREECVQAAAVLERLAEEHRLAEPRVHRERIPVRLGVTVGVAAARELGR